jgi:hypothetical protein
MDAETLDSDFYRERARFCHDLAETARGTKPLFSRLFFLRAHMRKRPGAPRRPWLAGNRTRGVAESAELGVGSPHCADGVFDLELLPTCRRYAMRPVTWRGIGLRALSSLA